MQFCLPGTEIGLFGQLACGAEPIEHAGIVRIGVEKGPIEVPQPAIGIVIECEPALSVEYRNAGGELIERAAMCFRHPHQRRAQGIGLAGVDRDADAAAADPDRADVVNPPLAAGHDRQPRAEGLRARQRPFHFGAVVAVEQFEVALGRIGDACGLGGARVGRIGIGEAAFGAFGPDRPWRGGGKAAQHFGFFQKRLVTQSGFRQFPAQATQLANPHNGLAADGAAHRLDGMSVRCCQMQHKALAGLTQRIHGVIHPQRRFRRQPGSERKNTLREFLRHQ